MVIRKSKDKTHDRICLHYHDYIELLYGLDCDATVLCGASEIKLASGDLVIIKSKVPHNVMSNSEKSTYSVIKFMPQILYAAEQPIIEFKYIIPFITSEGGGCRLSCRDACALAREHGLDEHDETVGRLNALLRELLQGIQ